MTPSIRSAICKECGRWKEEFKELKDMSFICVDCYQKEAGEDKNEN